ncbi:MAG: sigma-54 dependent transcriptional regulator [Myxococcota bacterium]
MSKHKSARVLIVDDELEMAAGLAEYLQDHGYDTELATSGEQAIDIFGSSAFDVVVSDLRMQGMGGFDLLDNLKRLDATVPVFIMTAFGSIENAVEAVKRGAFHYFSKPLKSEEVRVFLDRAVSQRRLEKSRTHLLRDAEDRYSFESLVGRSQKMRQIFDLIDRVSEGHASVLITGESGTGKELVARAIHFRGPKRKNPFVLMNCTAIPATLLESELFGHEKGSYTGATKGRAGLAVEASGGTLFLDEIGDLHIDLQPKLLRLLQEGEVRAVGSDKTRRVDVRVVAATNVDLQTRIADGRFRSDLYYRLNVVPIHLPPLRERPEDLPILSERLLTRVRQQNPHLSAQRLSENAQNIFLSYDWPGNVRELGNVIERAATLCTGDIIGAEHVAFLERRAASATPTEIMEELPSLREMENRYIEHVLNRVEHNKVKAAAILGVDPSTLYRRRKRP